MEALLTVGVVLAVVAVLYLGLVTLILRFSLKPIRIHQRTLPPRHRTRKPRTRHCRLTDATRRAVQQQQVVRERVVL